LLINTLTSLSFNGVGQNHNLIVAGSTSDTDITDNSEAAITISNKDGTANNTAGLHFAREDTDGTPHYDGASIVAQFKETMNTGQYPKADLAFLTSTTNNNAPSEKMRIVSQGRVRIKCEDMDNDPSSSNRGVVIGDSTTGSTFSNGSATGTANNIIFFNGNGLVGKISTNGSTTTYHTSSDYRLKENAVAISDGITRLKTLKPYRFNFKADAGTTLDGFFAHEVSSAVPEAVEGTKDELYTEDWNEYKVGDPKMQSIDQSKLVPLLTAALQEAITEIETLKTRVAALEG